MERISPRLAQEAAMTDRIQRMIAARRRMAAAHSQQTVESDVADHCSEIAHTLPKQRLDEGHVDQPQEVGRILAGAFRSYVQEQQAMTAAERETAISVSERCATIAAALPAERIEQGYRDDATALGREIAMAIDAEFGLG
jgi:hypothetical protein